MNHSKIQLSAEEWQLVQNSRWILTKHGIIDKVYRLFGQLAQHMQSLPLPLPPEVLHHAPKISKGEQYERLPWVVLDYPRHFSRDNVFAIRNFFWWGNYFSSTLHLKGIYLRQLAPAIIAMGRQGALAGYYWSASGHEFDFKVTGAGYTPVAEMPVTAAVLHNSPFIKLTVTHPLEQWDGAEEKLLEAFRLFVTIASR